MGGGLDVRSAYINPEIVDEWSTRSAPLDPLTPANAGAQMEWL
jgi:hypothetical protein